MIPDSAFSLDSISAAVAISDRFVVIIIGCGIGVFALRFLADLFQVWMEKFVHLELSGYLAIALVAAKLLAEIIYPALVVPELIEVAMIFCIFAFGFSKQHESESLVNS
ncbi:MAG: Conserved rane protein TerC [Cyanobacteriota bacterium]|jgi:predicted tellurium resistance membrane protein TerC